MRANQRLDFTSRRRSDARSELAADVAAFLASGGKVVPVAQGETATPLGITAAGACGSPAERKRAYGRGLRMAAGSGEPRPQPAPAARRTPEKSARRRVTVEDVAHASGEAPENVHAAMSRDPRALKKRAVSESRKARIRLAARRLGYVPAPPKRRKQGPRQVDVAEAAGVSISQAHNALKGHDRVAPAVRARCVQAADRLGYPVSPEARSLAGGR